MSMSENESKASTAELLASAARALRSPSPAADRAGPALRLEAATRPPERRETERRLLSQITARAGAGLLPEEVLDHVFHRLIANDCIRPAIARRIAKAHGGIGVDLTPGGDAELRFPLPDSGPPDQPDRAVKLK